VTALSYGWWIQQVPETLMGTAIATALLPTLSNLAAEGEEAAFKDTIERSLRVMISLSLPLTVIISLVSLPLIQTAFGFSLGDAQMILWATQGYMIGLLGHSIVEVGVRSYYARQNAAIPMMVSFIGLAVYIGLALALMGPLAAGGIALANSLSYSIQALILVLTLNKRLPEHFRVGPSFLRGAIGAILGGAVSWLIFQGLNLPISALFLALGGAALGAVVAAIPIWKDLKLLVNL
jgi:putative peptidoglycan lipid II flippase